MRVKLRLFACILLLALPALMDAQQTQTVPSPTSPAGVTTAARFPDTILTRQVAEEKGWFERVTGVASGLISIALLVLTVALVPAAWNFRKNHKVIREMIERFQGDIAPLLRHANAIADDVNYVTTSIRADIRQVNQTIAAANRRLLDTVDKAEERITELNALVAVAQEEVESAFISTASTLRGIKTGAAALAGGGRRRRRARDRDLQRGVAQLDAAVTDDLHTAVRDVGPALDQSFDEEEEIDGNDGRSAADRRG